MDNESSQPAVLKPFWIAGWCVDPSMNRVSRGSTTVKLEPRTMKLLVYLSETAGETVTREQLEGEVWRGMVVGYDALNNAITKLRKALADDPRHPQIIETIPKVGYRLVGQISRSRVDAELADAELRLAEAARRDKLASRRHVSAATVFLGLVTVITIAAWFQPWQRHVESPMFVHQTPPFLDKPSVAVLPFENLSGDAKQQYFSDGITEDLITDLARVSGLSVIARSSSFAYREKPTDVRDIGHELGVRYVLEGSVRRSGDQVRITAQLIDATTGRHVWTDRYDRKYHDVFALQTEVIGKIVSALAVTLTDVERAQIARRQTNDLEAYDYYLRAEARARGWSDHPRRTSEVLSLYEKAIALDPRFADAHAGLALMAVDIWRYGRDALPGPVARKRAYEAASRAVFLDPKNSRAYAVLAILQSLDNQHQEALKSAQQAVSLDPNNGEAYIHLSQVLTHAGRHAEALAAVRKAFRIDPNPLSYFYGELGSRLFWNRQYEDAVEPLERARRAGVLYFTTLAMTYAQLGRLDDAKAVVAEIYKRVPFANLNYYRVLYRHYKRKEDLEHLIVSLRAAGIPEWPFGFKADKKNLLDENTMKIITLGRTWIGRAVNDMPFIQQTTKDGKVAFRDPTSLMTGTVWIERGMICHDLPLGFVNRSGCGLLFRNPSGTAKQQNEYIQAGIADILYFSLKP